jgi:hypothetical protein
VCSMVEPTFSSDPLGSQVLVRVPRFPNGVAVLSRPFSWWL